MHLGKTEIRVKDWAAFEREIAKLENSNQSPWHEVLFRGQSNARWPLSTTLENDASAALLL
jgi:hypothetical protein